MNNGEPFHEQLRSFSYTHTHTSIHIYIHTYIRIQIDGRYRSIGMKKNVHIPVCIKKNISTSRSFHFSFILFFNIGSEFNKKVKWLTS